MIQGLLVYLRGKGLTPCNLSWLRPRFLSLPCTLALPTDQSDEPVAESSLMGFPDRFDLSLTLPDPLRDTRFYFFY